MVPRYVANEAARRLQAELCSRGQSGGWLSCRARENHVKDGARERAVLSWVLSQVVATRYGMTIDGEARTKQSSRFFHFPRAAQSRINKDLSNHRR